MASPRETNLARQTATSVNSINIKEYLRSDLRGDLVAATTVTAVAIPQAMAYAIIAGVPPAYGLYTGIVTCIVGSLLRGSSYLITGPTNATAMAIASVMQSRFTPVEIPQMVLLLTFLSGLIQVSFGLLRLSGVARYISNSVVVGLTAGAGILIAGNQLRNLFGLHKEITNDDMSNFVFGVAKLCWKAAENLIHFRLPLLPTALGVFTIVFILAAKRLAPRLPGPLLGVIVSAIAIKLFDWHGSGVQTIEDLGSIARSLDIFKIPDPIARGDLNKAGTLFPGALAVAILGLVEAVSIAKALSTQSKQRVDFTREFLGQGLANVVGAFFQCFVGSGSFTRSATNYQSGARTRMAGVYSGVMTALVVLAFAPYANWIPIASLAGLLIVMSTRMIDRQYLRLAWHSGSASRMVFLVTFGSAVVFGLKYAIFVGVFASIVFLLRATGEPGIRRIILHPNGDVEELPPNSVAVRTPVALIDLTGDFYFAAVQDLDLKLRHVIPPETKVLILRMREMRVLGSTGVGMLGHFCESMREQGITVILAGVEEELERVIRRSGFQKEIGEENIFYADNIVFRATQLAFARARALVEAQQTPVAAATEEERAKEKKAEKVAKDLMRADTIRFGVNHRLREAVWLFREGRRTRRSLKRLFLQGNDARIAGAIDVRRVLTQFLEAFPKDASGKPGEPNDEWIQKGWQKLQNKRLAAIAKQDPRTVSPNSSLPEIGKAIYGHGVDVIPVTDDGRVVGQIRLEDIVIAMRERLKRQ